MTVWPNGSQSIPRVTDEYGWREAHPVTGARAFHYGIDLIGFALNCSPAHGVVIFAAYNGGAGNEVRVRADNGDVFRIKHNASFLVGVGQRVSEGQPVGVMGTTGQSTGVHCHFETWPGNAYTVNPRDYMGAAISNPAGGGATAFGSTRNEDDMTLYRASNNSGDGLIQGGWLYKQVGTGPVCAVSNLESIALAASGQFIANYAGEDIRILGALYGFAEHERLTNPPKLSNGQYLYGPGKLTGRIIYSDNSKPEYPKTKAA